MQEENNRLISKITEINDKPDTANDESDQLH